VSKIGYFRRQHSLFLCQHFDISINGIDYYNSHNVGFEFKETYSPYEKNKFFKIPLKQVKIADYFVFCENTSNFFIVESREIRNRYTFKNKRKKANIRINVVKQMAIFHTKYIEILKKMIEMIKE